MKILSLTPSPASENQHDWKSFNSTGTYHPILGNRDEENFQVDSLTTGGDWEHEQELIHFLYDQAADTIAELHLIKNHQLLIVSEATMDSTTIAQWQLFRWHDENTRIAGGYTNDLPSAINAGLNYAYQSK